MEGLAGRIGLPNADIEKGMEDEHLRMPNRFRLWGLGLGLGFTVY
jgi:hypothetical protein